MSINFVCVVLFILIPAGWRLASLFANEDGAFHVFKKIRGLVVRAERRIWIVREFHLYEGLTCEWCNSVWFGSAIVIFYWFFGDVVAWVCLPLTISCGAIILKYVIQSLEQVHEILVKLNGELPSPTK